LGNGKIRQRKNKTVWKKGQQKINVRNNGNGKKATEKTATGKMGNGKFGNRKTRQQKWTGRKKGNTKYLSGRNGNGTLGYRKKWQPQTYHRLILVVSTHVLSQAKF